MSIRNFTGRLTVSVVTASALANTAPTQPFPVSLDTALVPRVIITQGPPELRQTQTLGERMESAGVPGISIAVVVDGELRTKGFGVADVEARTPVTPATLFQAASISKPVAAVGAMRLVQEGVLALDRDIASDLTSWVIPPSEALSVQNPNAPRVTLRGLLSHTAGVNVHGFPGYDRDEPYPNAIGVLRGEGNTDPVTVTTTPGTEHVYSGGGYTIAQVAMVDATRFEDFPTLMASMVFEPLGMESSTFTQVLPPELRSRAATGYAPDGTAVPGGSRVHPEMAAAGLWSTPTDLARLFLSIRQGLDGLDGPVLTAASVEDMFRYDVDTPYGLGLSVRPDSFGHSGSNFGFKCLADFFRDSENGVVIMANGDAAWSLNGDVRRTVFDEMGWPGLEPVRKSVVALAPDQLERCAGSYTFEGYGTVTVTVNSTRTGLAATLPDGFVVRLFPESETRFFDPTDGEEIDFDLPPAGPARGLNWSGSIATRDP